MAGRCGLAGHAVNPAPRSGPAAGGCAFGRLRSSASQAKHPHPWGLDGALLVCAVLRTRQDRSWGVLPNPPEACLGPMAPTVLPTHTAPPLTVPRDLP